MHRDSSTTAAAGRTAPRRSYHLGHVWCLGVTAVIAAVMSVATAQSRPDWVLSGDAREAYVEAYSFPSGVAQVDTGIFVVCDDQAPRGLNVILWTGSFGVSVPERVEGLVRREQDAPRRHPFLVFGAGPNRAAPLYFEDVDLFLDDLRRGGSMAVRLLLLPGVAEASQPTYQYDVSGFEAVEARLACRAGSDPFATPATADPFASPAPAPTPPAATTPPPAASAATPAPPAVDAPASAPSGRVAAAEPAQPSSRWFFDPEPPGGVFAGNDDYTVLFVCDGDLPLLLLGGARGGALPPATFAAFIGTTAETVYTFVEVDDSIYALMTDGFDGVDGLLVALAIMASFDDDVAITLVSDGPPRELIRLPGGTAFVEEWRNLPCASQR